MGRAMPATREPQRRDEEVRPDAGTAGVGALPFVFLDDLEVTQEPQGPASPVPLVAGRATIARAYLNHPAGALAVCGELRIAPSPFGPWRGVPSLGVARLDPSRSGTHPAQLRTRRADPGLSLNFAIPPDLTRAGSLWLRVGAIRRENGTAVASVAGLTTRAVTFRVPPPRAGMLRAAQMAGGPPGAGESVHGESVRGDSGSSGPGTGGSGTGEPGSGGSGSGRTGTGAPGRRGPAPADMSSSLSSWLRRVHPLARLLGGTTVTATRPARRSRRLAGWMS